MNINTNASLSGLFVRAVVQVFKTDAELVAFVGKASGMNRKQRAGLADGLAAMRREGRDVSHLQGLSLAGAAGVTVVAAFPGGRAGIGIAVVDEPGDLETIKAKGDEDIAGLPDHFAVVIFPAGAIAGGVQ